MNLEEIYGKFPDFEYKIKARKSRNILVEGVGINDVPFVVRPTIGNKKVIHPAYTVWQHMLQRCYNAKVKEKHPTYTNITCCEEWLSFSNFALWFKDNYIHGYHLDKDLLVKENRIYAPDTCIFSSPEINAFLTIRGNCRGNLPLGVSLHLSKFRAVVSNNSKQLHLGCFNTKEEAHQAWQKAKLEQAIAFNFPPLQRVIDQLTYEIENNLETISL